MTDQSYFPQPSEGKLQWPMVQDLKHLNVSQLDEFAIEKIQFWDFKKLTDDSQYNIAFRIFGKNGL